MQKKGVVMVWYDFSYDLKLEAELMIKGVKFVQSVPWRTAGVHFCSTKPQFGSFATFVHFALGRAGRLRFRAHSGKEKETYIYAYKSTSLTFSFSFYFCHLSSVAGK